MEADNGEERQITKLLRDAFVRICRLAVADTRGSTGLSVTKLTLHLTVEVNTAAPHTLSTTIVETIQEACSQPRDSSTSNVLEKLERGGGDNADGNKSVRDKVTSISDLSAETPIDVNSIGIAGVDTTAGASCLAVASFSRESCGTATFSSSESNHTVTLNDVDNLGLNETKSVKDTNGCTAYSVLSSAVDENSRDHETDALCKSGCISLQSLSSSEIATSSECLLSELQSYAAGIQFECSNTDHTTGCELQPFPCTSTADQNSSFLGSCDFQQPTNCSDAGCIDPKSMFCEDTHGLQRRHSDETDLGKLRQRNKMEFNEVNTISRSQSEHLHNRVVNSSAKDGGVSCEDKFAAKLCLVSCNQLDHLSTNSNSDACSLRNVHPPSTVYAANSKDLFRIKPVSADYFLSTLSPAFSTSEGLVVPTSLQVNVTSTGSLPSQPLNNCKKTASACNAAAYSSNDSEFQKILTSLSTNVSAVTDADRDNLRTLGVYAGPKYIGPNRSVEDRMKQFPCTQCHCSFSMQTNLRRHIKKSHTQSQQLWRPISHAGGADRPVTKLEVSPKPRRKSSKDSLRYRHKCSVCNAAFTLRTNLTRHVRKAHVQTISA